MHRRGAQFRLRGGGVHRLCKPALRIGGGSGFGGLTMKEAPGSPNRILTCHFLGALNSAPANGCWGAGTTGEGVGVGEGKGSGSPT